MHRMCVSALLASALSVPAFADPLQITPDAYAASRSWDPGAVAQSGTAQPGAAEASRQRYAEVSEPSHGGGFLEFLFGGAARQPAAPRAYQPGPADYAPYPGQQPGPYYNDPRQSYASPEQGDPSHAAIDPKFNRQVVAYQGGEAPGTVVIDTPHRFLYLVEDGGRALRYGIGVGRPGFTWAGEKTITAKREWPDWRPPDDMLRRRPDLPRYMAGGPDNPLGARALYLGSTLYRIHGSNEPWTIGTQVSSGCIRMRNEDVTDLYGRVRVGTKVLVM